MRTGARRMWQQTLSQVEVPPSMAPYLVPEDSWSYASLIYLLRDRESFSLFPVDDEPWMKAGTCASVGSDEWFPEDGFHGTEARRICWEECPVREECLEYALRTGQRWGIWGGLSEIERRPLKVRHCRTCGVEIPRRINGNNAPMRCQPCRAKRRKHERKSKAESGQAGRHLHDGTAARGADRADLPAAGLLDQDGPAQGDYLAG